MTTQLIYSAQCFHDVSAVDPHGGEEARMLFVDSVQLMPKNDPDLVVLGWQSHLCPSLCLSFHLLLFRWKVNQVQKRQPGLPFGLFAFILFSCWKQKWISLHWALLPKEMMQRWSRGTREKGPLCKPRSSLCYGVRGGPVFTPGSSTELWFLNVDPFLHGGTVMFYTVFVYYSSAFLTTGLIHFDCNTKYGRNWFKLLGLLFPSDLG